MGKLKLGRISVKLLPIQNLAIAMDSSTQTYYFNMDTYGASFITVCHGSCDIDHVLSEDEDIPWAFQK